MQMLFGTMNEWKVCTSEIIGNKAVRGSVPYGTVYEFVAYGKVKCYKLV